jgi:hypothetical protein
MYLHCREYDSWYDVVVIDTFRNSAVA